MSMKEYHKFRFRLDMFSNHLGFCSLEYHNLEDLIPRLQKIFNSKKSKIDKIEIRIGNFELLTDYNYEDQEGPF